MENNRLHIAVGVIFNQERNRVLVARRPDGIHQGGLWEFPGGKCGSAEGVRSALARELLEELGLVVDDCRPLIVVDHDYEDKQVKLDVWSVDAWHGNIHGREGQPIEWVPLSDLRHKDFPAANIPIIEALMKN